MMSPLHFIAAQKLGRIWQSVFYFAHAVKKEMLMAMLSQ